MLFVLVLAVAICLPLGLSLWGKPHAELAFDAVVVAVGTVIFIAAKSPTGNLVRAVAVLVTLVVPGLLLLISWPFWLVILLQLIILVGWLATSRTSYTSDDWRVPPIMH